MILSLVFTALFMMVGCASSFSQMPQNIRNGGRAVAITVHPSNADQIVVASETGGIFKSKNIGVNWSQVSGSSTFYFLDVAYLPVNPKFIIAVADADTRTISGGGIWRSTNGGKKWSKPVINPPTPDCEKNFSAFCLFAEKERNRVWAGTTCGLAFSDDKGATWQYLPAGKGYNNDKVYAVLAPTASRIIILTDAGVKVSMDNGSSWSVSNLGLPGDRRPDISNVHNQIAVSPYNYSHLYWVFNYWESDWHVAFYRSTNNGASWSKLIDKDGLNRPPFVRIARSISGSANQYDIYFGDGGCGLERATVTDAANPTVSAWTSLNFDHCDPADLAFSTDNKTPLLLATDGGLHITNNKGSDWTYTGGGKNGYNALQITEVTGQLHRDGNGADIYFGTQDNNIWASPDIGITWSGNKCCEGFFLNIPRQYYPTGQTKLTGVACGACGNFISGPLLAGHTGFPNPPNDIGNPCLLKPGHYIQNTKVPGLPGSIFALTADTGTSWTNRYGFPEEVRDLSKVSGPTDSPMVYTAIKVPGANPDGSETVQIKRIANVLAGSTTPLVSNINNFGSLGVFPTMFAWYKPFGVDPTNPNILIVPDIIDGVMKASTDGGATWNTDHTLTNLVTQGGKFKFTWNGFTQISAIGFDPDWKGHVLVGTQQAGVFQTFDYGAHWKKIKRSERIPLVSSFFFSGNGKVIASSYGRGLWRLKYKPLKKPVIIFEMNKVYEEPVIHWKGGEVALSQIHDPDACPACGFFLVKGGTILDYRLGEDIGQIREVFLSGGEIKGYRWDGEELDVPFAVSYRSHEEKKDVESYIKTAIKQHSGKTQVRGLFVERNILKGLIMASSDVTLDQLPKKKPLGPHILIDEIDSNLQRISVAGRMNPITVRAYGFRSQYPVEIFLDGKVMQMEQIAKFDKKEVLTFSIPKLMGIGGHTILVKQSTPEGVIQDAITFIITVQDFPKEK